MSREMRTRVSLRDKFRNPCIELSDVLCGDRLDLRARTMLIPPEREQEADLLDGTSPRARLVYEVQYVDLILSINPVSALAQPGDLYQVNALLVADHFGGDAGGARCLSYAHGTPCELMADYAGASRVSCGVEPGA